MDPAPDLGRLDAEWLIADLDADQRRAVTAEPGVVAVIAGAGSGKTRVLTRRVAYRAATGTADPAHTLVLTFTREAAGELRRRLPRLGLTGRVAAGTFHSIAHGLLRQRWADRGVRPRELVPDRERLVRSVIDVRGGEAEAVMTEVNWATARGITAAEYTRLATSDDRRGPADPRTVAAALDAYRAAKGERGQIDVDDLLVFEIDELAGDPTYREAVRWRYRHLLVDEAQDLNPLQQRLVDLLAPPGDPTADLFLVGDPAQSIFGFNGSDPALLIDVERHFPGVEVIRLPVNHRCTPQVVAAGSAVLAAGGQPTDVVSARPDGALVEIVPTDDEQAEAAFVTRQVSRLDPGLVRSGRVAVLARTHAVLRTVAEALAGSGVPVRHTASGPGSQLAPFLRLAYRISNTDQLRHWAHDHLDEAAELAEVSPTTAAAGAAVARAVLDYLSEQPTGDGAGLRAWVSAADPFGDDTAGVELLTFHGSKGREWHTVFLVGCETSLVPHRSATTQPAKAEEARLLYVAITRATDHLTISWARRRGGYQRKPTPYLEGFRSTAPPAVPPPPELLGARHRAPRELLVDRLHEWRRQAARAAALAPEAIMTDRMLIQIADRPPQSADELDRVTGVGLLTARRLWPGLQAVLDPDADAARV